MDAIRGWKSAVSPDCLTEVVQNYLNRFVTSGAVLLLNRQLHQQWTGCLFLRESGQFHAHRVTLSSEDVTELLHSSPTITRPLETLVRTDHSITTIFPGRSSLEICIVVDQEQLPPTSESNHSIQLLLLQYFTEVSRLALLNELEEVRLQNAREMQLIAALQKSLLPNALPVISTLQLAVEYLPSSHAGGDYYHVLRLPRGRWGILVADVSGHGGHAAMVMAIVHSLIQTYSGPTSQPGLLLEYINRHLVQMETHSKGIFVTAVYAVYDQDRAVLQICNAGHPAPRMRNSVGNSITELRSQKRIPLGIMAEVEYQHTDFSVRPGDEVLFFTDGVTDATNENEEPFGLDRLDQAVLQSQGNARNTIQQVLSHLDDYLGTAHAADDCTLLVASFVKSKKKAGEITGEFKIPKLN
ncbi:MAG: PP2C family protein-serine/threonine phosphatase [Zavarzinella sp.]